MAEQQKKPEASGSFDGIFTLKTREEAEELSLAVRFGIRFIFFCFSFVSSFFFFSLLISFH